MEKSTREVEKKEEETDAVREEREKVWCGVVWWGDQVCQVFYRCNGVGYKKGYGLKTWENVDQIDFIHSFFFFVYLFGFSFW